MKPLHRQILAVILIAVGIFFLLQTTVQSFVVVGASMEPTFKNGQRLLVNKAIYRLREPQMGEVIVFHPPTNQRADFIKRIIALPSDTVEIKGGAVYINNSELREPYIKAPPSYTFAQQTISDNEYFVLGDNRNNSNDSHNDWTAKREDIIGKAWFSIWPPGPISAYDLQEQLD